MSREDDRNDEAVDSDGLAEDDRDQVLGLDPGGLDSTADDGHAGRVDAEGSAHDAQRDGEADAKRGPHVGRRLGEVPADADAFAAASQNIVEN